MDNVAATLSAINQSIQSLKTPWFEDPTWWATLLALLLGTGFFGLTAYIKERRKKKPKLAVSIRLDSPDSLKIPVTSGGRKLYDTYYLRFKVDNIGDYRMEDVEVVALELYKKGDTNRFSEAKWFLPMNLTWADANGVTMPKIQPHLSKHCNFGHIIQNSTPYVGEKDNLVKFEFTNKSSVIFILDTSATPNTGSNYLLPGEYKIKLVFAANNFKPIPYWYKFKIEDQWNDDEEQMLANNISIDKIT